MSTPARTLNKNKAIRYFVAFTLLVLPVHFVGQEYRSGPAIKGRIPVVRSSGILWEDPKDIASRNLFYGAGGEKSQPKPGFVFVEEEDHGSNAKFVVKDKEGQQWKVKVGMEAQAETAASRFVWAVGYRTPEYYYLEETRVEGMQPLHHGRDRKKWVRGELIYDARFKRTPGKKVEDWAWNDNLFQGTREGARELNGLRVMMALVNNWDLKSDNNGIYEDDQGRFYLVSDLGATFGAPRLAFPFKKSRNHLAAFQSSKFITRTDAQSVDFATPGHPSFVYWFSRRDYKDRSKLKQIGRNIPRADARWIGKYLERLSTQQIHDAFRAGGYSAQEIEGFSQVIQARIRELNKL